MMISEVEQAKAIARKQHAGQTRWDKVTPYITHPIAVSERFDSPLFKVVALLHDVVEDTPMTLDRLREAGVREHAVKCVDHLTKREGEEYLAYIQRVASDPISAAVKVADIEHNLMNLKKGSMRDKYHLARELLYMYAIRIHNVDLDAYLRKI